MIHFPSKWNNPLLLIVKSQYWRYKTLKQLNALHFFFFSWSIIEQSAYNLFLYFFNQQMQWYIPQALDNTMITNHKENTNKAF